MDEDLLHRLVALESRAEIEGVFARYAGSIDERSIDGLKAIFTEDLTTRHGLLSPPGSSPAPGGRNRFLANVQRFIDANPCFQHYIMQVESTIEGEEASASASMLLVRQAAGLGDGEVILEGGRYRARLRRTAEGWRIHHLFVDVLWLEPAARDLYPR